MDSQRNSFKAGMIMLWSGSIASIPNGWALCNGSSGTPDLRSRFLIGAGGSYAVNATGGTSTHDHAITDEGHDHNIETGEDIQSGEDFDAGTTNDQSGVTVDYTNHLPPYFALAYIMKL